MSHFRAAIDALDPYVPGEQPQGGKAIKLNTNENPYPPSPAVARAIGTAVKMGLQRYPDPTALAFRTRAAQVLGVEPDWILCGNGSDEILTLATRAFVGEGSWLRLPYPSYILYKTLAQIQERVLGSANSSVSVDRANIIAHAGTGQTAVPNLCTPSDPTARCRDAFVAQTGSDPATIQLELEHAIETALDRAMWGGTYSAAQPIVASVFELGTGISPTSGTPVNPLDPRTRYDNRVNILYQSTFDVPGTAVGDASTQ